MYSEPWAKLAAAIVFVGFNLTFFPQFIARLHRHAAPLLDVSAGVPGAERPLDGRRVDPGVGYIMPLVYLTHSMLLGEKSPADPWGAKGLEWEIPSPPPTENFTVTPVVTHGTHQYAPKVGVV
jgi:cytochrome c oxidase subunit I